MGFNVYDYRKDIRNVLITPQIRARFIRIEVGDISGGPRQGQGHSHDLGHEIFLVLQGQAEFEIDGATEVVGPGQMCVALVDEIHTVRNVGDDPVILYLSVTPHIQPTHTFYTESGEKAPPRFIGSQAYDVKPDTTTSIDALADRQMAAAEALRAAVERATEAQREHLAALKEYAAAGKNDAARDARDAIWDQLYPMYSQMYELADAWNALTYRTAETDV